MQRVRNSWSFAVSRFCLAKSNGAIHRVRMVQGKGKGVHELLSGVLARERERDRRRDWRKEKEPEIFRRFRRVYEAYPI